MCWFVLRWKNKQSEARRMMDTPTLNYIITRRAFLLFHLRRLAAKALFVIS